MPETKTEFKRSLGLVDATMIVAGSMIGSGIFIVSAFMSRDLGSAGWLLVVWLITGFITLSAALSYGELAGMMPNAGGQYVYIHRAFGPFTSFLYGWSVFTVIQTGVIAAVAVAFAKYAAVFWPVLSDAFFSTTYQWRGEPTDFIINYGQLIAIVSIILLTFINSRGINNGKLIQLVFTSSKLLALFALIVLGLIIGLQHDTLAQNFTNMWQATKTTFDADSGIWNVETITGLALLGAMGATIINSLFSSDAWNNVTFIAGEIKQPEKNIPRSLFLGTLIVTILYIMANVAYLALLPLHGNPDAVDVMGKGIQFADNDRVGAAAASMIFGDSALYLMAGLIMVSTFGCNNGIVLAGARLYYAMAKDKLFFAKAGTLNKTAVPGFGLWIQCLWACLLCLTGTYRDLVNFATFASMIFYIFTIGGLFILRKKEPNTPRPYKAFGYPLIPALYILFAIAICVALVIYDTRNTIFALSVIAVGIPVYYLFLNNSRSTE